MCLFNFQLKATTSNYKLHSSAVTFSRNHKYQSEPTTVNGPSNRVKKKLKCNLKSVCSCLLLLKLKHRILGLNSWTDSHNDFHGLNDTVETVLNGERHLGTISNTYSLTSSNSIRAYWRIFCWNEAELLDKCAEHQLHLFLGKTQSNTITWTQSKRHERVRIQLDLILRTPSVGNFNQHLLPF